MPTYNGTAGNDTINGSSVADSIYGLAGNDRILTGDGDDYVEGGDGNDEINGYATSNGRSATLYSGKKTINGGLGNDFIVGGSVDDRLFGDAGNDTVYGDAGNDYLEGGDGNDQIHGGAGNDLMLGGAGDDTFDWDPAERGGSDTMVGGLGNDQYVIDSLSDVIQENQNEGDDLVWTSSTFSLATIANVERLSLFGTSAANLTGNALNNTLSGNSAANEISGGEGSDTVYGNGGNDTLDGGAGTDVAMFSGSRSSFSVAYNSASGEFTLTSSAEGVIVVRNIETFSFNGVRYSSALLTDTTPPRIISSLPIGSTSNLDVNTNLTIDFSEPIYRGAGSIILRNATSGSVVESFEVSTSSRVSISGSRITIDPARSLPFDSEIRVELSAGVVTDLAGNGNAAAQTLAFRTESNPDTIAGNVTSTASLSPTNYQIQGRIDYTGDEDWYRAELESGWGYQIWVEGAGSSNGTLRDPFLAIYSVAGSLISSNDDRGYGYIDSYLYFTPAVAGTYFIAASEFGGDAVGTYLLTVRRDLLDNTSTAARVAVGGEFTANIGWNGDRDWVGVTLTAGTTYQFDLIGSGNDGVGIGMTLADPWLALLSSAGVLIKSNDDSGLGLNSRIIFTPSVSGTYFLSMEEAGDVATGTLRLLVNSSPISGPILIGNAVNGSIESRGDIDLYSISLSAGKTYVFDVTGVTLLDPFLELLDSSYVTVIANNDSGSGKNSSLTFTPSTSGTYYLLARSSGHIGTGSYTASVTELPELTVDPVTCSEQDGFLTLTLRLSSASSNATSVRVTTIDLGNATVGADYQDISATVTFLPGQSTATFTVPIINDTRFEPAETIYFRLSSGNGLSIIDDTAWGVIFDNDPPYPIPIDDLLPFQWYLYPGAGANVLAVWPEFTGRGVRIGVFDQGIDNTHPDLDGNVAVSLGRRAIDLSLGGKPLLTSDNHGTVVAGVIGAERNGSGTVGVAYGATLVSIYTPFGGGPTDTPREIVNAYTYALNLDVLNDSWGFAPQAPTTAPWGFYDNFRLPVFAAAGAALKRLADEGRNGLGVIVVQSAGNSFRFGDDTNLHNFQNSRYIITVAATDYTGSSTSYSSRGASILVSAPGGGNEDYLSNIISTDRAGTDGYVTGDYHTLAGTSFSAPIVSGVVGLMLEANPRLGYRDVQTILAYSASMTAPSENTWQYNRATDWNGGGLHFDGVTHDLGFGLVDARAAVRLAETWRGPPSTSANDLEVSATLTQAQVIPDGSSSLAQIIKVTQPVRVERVEVTVDIRHTFIGDLSILLTSPGGTQSWLMWRPGQSALSSFGLNQDNINFTFNTVLCYGESGLGDWKLAVFDMASGDVGQLRSWSINLIGSVETSNNTYFYTDEFSESVMASAGRGVLSDTGGYDAINTSAVTTNSIIRLSPGSTCHIDGATLNIATGTVIEVAYGGDGNDEILGNNAANELFGMRGSDSVSGGEGNDSLYGGAGNDHLDGGDGSDTAVYSGASGGYRLLFSNNALRIQDRNGTDGTDTLSQIERLQFNNKSVIVESRAHSGFSDIPASMYQFFILAFGAAPGVEYLQQCADAYRSGASVKVITNVFTTKSQFTDTYPTTLSHRDLATKLINNVVGNSASQSSKTQAITDISGALDGGLSVGSMIFTVFSNLAAKPLSGDEWSGTAKLFQNQIAVAKYYTETMSQGTTDVVTLRAVISAVTPTSDVSTESSLVSLVGLGLFGG
jgi:Ca2+-binding RTX toxin-like protein